jgi:cytoskeletal protein CcmA (bactofilin family)
MFAKSKSVSEDWRLQPLQRSAVTQPVAMLHPSETISSISSEMTVVGKIVCEGVVKIYGLVEGEVIASNALIADGARIQGDIAAEELTISGRVKGNIHALRVKLQTTAVVEGDIFHRLLSIDEDAWFEGCSRPKDNPPEPRPSIKAESPNTKPRPLALVAFDDPGESKADDVIEEEPTQLRRTGTRAFLAACIAIVVIAVLSHFAISALQRPTGLAYTADNVRIDPSWVERSTQLGWTEPPPSPESGAIRASIPETSQTATVEQTAPETVAPKADAALLDPEQVPQMPQSLAAPPQTATVAQTAETIAPKADPTFLDPKQVPQMPQSLAALPQTVEQLAAGRAQMAREEAKLQAPDVEILAKVPLPRARPTVALARKSMSVLPRPARALTTPPSPWIPPR